MYVVRVVKAYQTLSHCYATLIYYIVRHGSSTLLPLNLDMPLLGYHHIRQRIFLIQTISMGSYRACIMCMVIRERYFIACFSAGRVCSFNLSFWTTIYYYTYIP